MYIYTKYNVHTMGDVILDALLDSLKILAVVVIFSYLIALIEPKLSDKIRLKGKLAPLIGVSVSLLPQCGFSVVATDLYHKRHITVGTLVGVYIATSDEALPIFLSNPDKMLHVLPLIALKFALGVILGYTIDFVCAKSRKKVEHHVAHCDDEYKIRLTLCESAELVVNEEHDHVEHCDCQDCCDSECPHDVPVEDTVQNEDVKKEKIKRFLISPLLHSLEIFAYVLVVNIIFGIIIYYIGEDRIIAFLTSNKYLAPLFSVIIGAIPNCVSSVVLSELYLMGGLGFGATLGGLCMNAGIGFVYLFKNTKHTKSNLAIFALMFVLSVTIAYIFSAIFNFAPLPI